MNKSAKPRTMDNVKQKLIDFGLFEQEAEAYIELLKKGEAKADDLIYGTKDHNDLIVALDSLADRNLIKKIVGNGSVYYKAEDPEKIFKNLSIKKAQAASSKEKIDQVVVNLDWIYNQTERPTMANSYRGYQGLLEARKKILSQKYDKIYNITALNKYLPRNHVQSLLSQVKNGFYAIIPKSDIEYLEKIKDLIDNEPKLKIKIIEDDLWQEKMEILIFGDCVSFGNNEDEQLYTMIEDKIVAVAMKNMFFSIWNGIEDEFKK